MVLYPKKLLPMDLASLAGGESIHKHVQVLISPTESEIEFNIADYELESLVQPVVSDTAVSETSIVTTLLTTEERSKIKLAEKAKKMTKTVPVKSKKQAPAPQKKEIKPHPRKHDKGVKHTKETTAEDEETTEEQPLIQSLRTSDVVVKHVYSRPPRALWSRVRDSLHVVAGLGRPPLFRMLPTEADLAGLILESMFQRNVEKKQPDLVTPLVDKKRKPETMQRIQTEDYSPEQTPEDVEDLSLPKFLLEMPEALTGEGTPTVNITIAVEQNKTTKIIHSFPKPLIKSLVKKKAISSQVKGETAKTKDIRSKLQKSEEASDTEIETPDTLKTPKESEPTLSSDKTKDKSERKVSTSLSAKTMDESESIETPSLPVMGKHKRHSLTDKKTKVKSDRRIKSASTRSKTTEESDSIEKPVPSVKGKRARETSAKKDKHDKTLLPTLPVQTLDERENIDFILARVKAAYKSDNIETRRSSASSLADSEQSDYADFKVKGIDEVTKGLIHRTASKRHVLKIVPLTTFEADDNIETPKSTKIDVPESLSPHLTDRAESSVDETVATESISVHSASIFGEPEDILFYEDSHEHPIVRTRLFTKQSTSDEKLPPIQGLENKSVDLLLEKAKKGRTFARKMSKTMEEQLNLRKPLSPEALVQDVKELDLQQALVMTSSAIRQPSQMKMWKDILRQVPESSSKCMKAASVDPKEAVDIYLHTKGINQLFQYLTTRLIMEEPQEPLDFLIGIMRNISYKRQFFYQMYKTYKG
ncbi:hypothetical protein BsWGS_01554 [Bradybaena similaris]